MHNRSESRIPETVEDRFVRLIKREKKLEELVQRTKASHLQTDLLPVEAIITVTEHEWIWQVVDKSMLSTLSHRIILDNPTLGRRVVMTSGIDAAVGVARTVTEIEVAVF